MQVKRNRPTPVSAPRRRPLKRDVIPSTSAGSRHAVVTKHQLAGRVGRASMEALSDAELVALAAAGHVAAFDPLYRRYHADVRRYAAHKARPFSMDPYLAEDIAADVWTVAMAKVGDLHASGPTQPRAVLAWLFAITQRQAYTTATQVHGRSIPVADEILTLFQPPPQDLDADEQQRQQLRERIYRALAQLGPVQRQVARLRLDGLTAQETAERTGMSPGQVKSAWQSARLSLQRRLTGGMVRRDHDDALSQLGALDDLAAAYETAEPGVHVEREQLRQRVAAAVERLYPAQRDVARLRLAGCTPAQIAEQTGLARNQIAGIWIDARANLVRALTDPAVSRAKTAAKARQELADAAPHLDETALTARIDLAVATLTPTQRQVARLKLDGATTEEIAAETGRSREQVYSNWNAARTALRQRLATPPVAAVHGSEPVPDALPKEPLARLAVLTNLATSASVDPAMVAELAQLRARVDQAVDRLRGMQAEVARHRVRGLSITETAQLTGYSYEQVKHNWRAAKPNLTRHLVTQLASVAA